MEILITGASSYVGARIHFDLGMKRTIGTYSSNRLFPYLQQVDITKKESVDKVVEAYDPKTIIHVAGIAMQQGLKDIDLTKRVNIDGTKNIVDAANRINAKVIYISSFAAIQPSNLYGETKKSAEEIVESTEAGYVIFRPSLMIGYSPNTENDRPHNRILKNITKDTSPVYDVSWNFQPAWVGHLSECVALAIHRSISNEIIPVAVPELTSRYELARDILSHFDIEAIAEDKNDTTPFFEVNLDKLAELGLPQYSYEEIIKKTLNEIL